ncbi:MAG: tail fiber domain-containing protein [Patescibacteria group bacterium]|nr:tail fiber domain-containing protein [Patescibacteria group bacterium]
MTPARERLITAKDLILLCQKQGIGLGRGNPNNRLRYFTKIGLIPHAQRKQVGVNAFTEGHYPFYTLQLLEKIQELKKAGKTMAEIGRIMTAEKLKYEVQTTGQTLGQDLSLKTPPPTFGFRLWNFGFRIQRKFVYTLAGIILLTGILVGLAVTPYGKDYLQRLTAYFSQQLANLIRPSLYFPEVAGVKIPEETTLGLKPQVLSENLLANPSFENPLNTVGTDGQGKTKFGQAWRWGYLEMAHKGNFYVSNDSVRSGTLAMKVWDSRFPELNALNSGNRTGNDRMSLGISQTETTTVNGRHYSFSVFLRSKDLLGHPKLRLGFMGQVAKDDPNYPRLAKDEVAASAPVEIAGVSGWTPFTFTYENAALGKYPFLEIIDYQGGVIYLDDASLVEISSESQLGSELAAGSSSAFKGSGAGVLVAAGFPSANLFSGAGSIKGDNSANFYPADDSLGSLGLTSKRFATLFVNDANLKNTLKVGGQAEFLGAATISGNLKIDNAKLILSASQLGSDLNPAENNKYNLGDGTTPLRWLKIWSKDADFSNAVSIGGSLTVQGTTLATTGNIETSGNLTVGGNSILGDSTTDTLTVSGTTTINLPDNTINAFDLQEGTNDYINIDTTNSSEKITLGSTSINPTLVINAPTINSVSTTALNLGAATLDFNGAGIIQYGDGSNFTLRDDGLNNIFKLTGSTNLLEFGSATDNNAFTFLGSGIFTIGSRLTVANTGLLTLVNNATIDNTTDGIITLTEPTIKLSGSTAVKIDSPTLDLSTQATNVDLKNTTVNALSFETSLLSLDTQNSRVGIGTTTPANKLTVSGNADLTGNLGIGTTTPGSKLGVLSNVSIGASYGNIAAPTSGLIVEGNVGIGTTNPGAYALQVAGATYLNGSVILGATTSDSLTVNGYVNSDLVPNPGSNYNLGSNTRRWLNVWADTVTATNLSGTVVTGATSAYDWLIGSANATTDTQDITLTFERGVPATNAEIRWNSTSKWLSTNAPTFFINPDSGITASGKAALIVNQIQNQDLFTASASGTPKFVIANSGNVGIGTTSPAYKLEVNGTLGVGSTASFTSLVNVATLTASSGVYTDASKNLTSTIPTTGSLGYWQRNGTNLAPATIGDSVGIGTTSPSAPLSVGATSQFQVSSAGAVTAVGVNSGSGLIQGTGGLTVTGTTNLNATGTSATAIGNATGNLSLVSNAFNLTTTGAVSGITTLSMNNQLTNSYANSAALNLTGNGSGMTFTGTGPNQIITAASQNLALMPGGNVGIGTTSPAYKLEVNGTLGVGSTASFTSLVNVATLTASSGVYTDASKNLTSTIPTTGSLGYWQRNGTNLAPATIGDSVGIGTTSPSAPLSVGATSQFQVSSAGAVTAVGVNSGSGLIQGTGGLTVTGTTNLNATGTSATAIGNATGNLSLVSNAFNLTTTGAVSGITTLSMNNQLTNSYANSAALNLTGNGSGMTFTGTGPNQIITAASQNLALMPGGNVGIGTTGPGYKLDVSGLGRFTDSVYSHGGFYPGNATLQTTRKFGDDGTWLTASNLKLAGTLDMSAQSIINAVDVKVNSDTLAIKNTGGNNKFVFKTSDGSLWIGGSTADGTAAAPLHVVGNGIFTGNVGIGTTSPGGSLEVAQTVTAASAGTYYQTKLDNTYTGTMNSATPVTSIYGMYNRPNIGIGGTSPQLTNLFVDYVSGNIGVGTTSSITNLYGLYVDNPTVNAGSSLTNNYGLYVNTQSAGTNNFALYSAGGTNYFGGNVGIGTTAPSEKLDVYGTIRSSNTTALYTQLGSNYIRSNGTQNFFVDNSATGVDTYLRVSNAGSLDTNAIVIKSTGNVGIGTTAPAALLHLSKNVDIASTYQNTQLRISGTSHPLKALFIGYDDTADFGEIQTFDAGTAAKNLALNPWGGNVGIGTTGPGYKLDVVGNSKFSTSVQTPYLNMATDGSINATDISFTSNGSKYGTIQTESYGGTGAWSLGYQAAVSSTIGTPVLTWNGSGNVGIGTTVPGAKLDVNGTSHYAGNLSLDQPVQIGFANGQTIKDNSAGGLAINSSFYKLQLIGGTDATNGLIELQTNNTVRMTITNGGNVGIGTTAPAEKLDVNGKVRATVFADQNGNYYIDPAQETMGASAILSGNVGIGTTGPGQKLDVNGTIRQAGCKTAGTLSANTSGDIICTSDENLKNIYGYYQGGLSALSALNPIRFSYKGEDFVHVGFSAQNVKSVLPEASALQDSGYWSLDTTSVVALTVNAIKEQQGQIATQSGSLTSLSVKLDENGNLTKQKFEALNSNFETKVSDLDFRISNLDNKYARLDSTLASSEARLASITAELKNQISLLTLGLSTQATISASLVNLTGKDATLSGQLTVLGRTLLSDLGLTGKITNGLLVVNGLEGSIETLALPLKLQATALGNIEMMGQKIVIDQKGNVKVEGTLTAKKVETEEFKVLGAKTAGSASLLAGQLVATISAEAATASARILLTPTTLTDKVLTVTEKRSGEFAVGVSATSSADIKFDWFIVGN